MKTRKKFLRRIWTDAENELLIKMFQDNYTSVVCEKLNRSYSSVVGQAKKLNLKKTDAFMANLFSITNQNLKIYGEKHRFVKGQEAHNKGVPMAEEVYKKASATFFKKGSLPHNTKYDGHERITKDGYVEVRVSLGKYKLKHRKIWEDANGPIPKDCIIVFRDKDKLNIMLDNLEMITTTENMRRNTIAQYSPELKEVINLKGKLNRIINGKDNNRRKRKSIQND